MNEQTHEKQYFRTNFGWVNVLQSAQQISGWLLGNTPGVPEEVVVSVNGVEIGRVTANQLHQRSLDSGMSPDGRCGFSLQLGPSASLKRGDVVRVRSAKGDIPLVHGVQRFGMPCSPTFSEGVTNCLIVGHSHVGCLMSASSSVAGLPLDASFIQLHHDAIPDAPGQLADAVINRVSGWLADFAGQTAEPVLVISPWGNEHNALGLMNHPVKFDFIHPEQPDLPLDEQAELLPYGAFREVMKKRCTHAFEIAERLSGFPVSKRYWIEAPPPVFSEEYISTYPRGYKDIVRRHGVAPAALRYKVWLLRATVIREWCRVHGWGYIPVPEVAKDEHGFLSPKAWPYWDAVHGNAWFGEVMLREIQAVAGKEMA